MTSSTGKRSFRACLRCRRRKTKCDLDGTGGRTESPCKSCRLSGDDCVLVRSRRGQWRNHTWRKSRASNANVPEASGDRNEVADPTNASSSTPQATILCATQSPKPRLASTTDHDRYLELKTPADALQILAQSNHQLSTDESSVARDSRPRLGIGRHAIGTGKLGLDGYELLKIGALSVSVIIELLQRYTTIYHPYCPLIPEYFLAVHAIEQITKIDHFLLTAVLTIASRDSPGHVLAHRYCWEHTQRLLLDVSLARTSTQTPRTVEGLLLLAEWLPHIETTLDTIEPATSLFGEDRLAWSLVGLAIRHGYLLHLDRGAFRDNTQATTEEDFRQNRLIWHFVYLADRHISVRLGQSFWSRGPSLSSYFTADDFPTLKPKPESTHDHSALLLANLELVQILYNAHLILYPSTQRTWTLIRDGDYARYLDDFLSTATSWHESWKHLETGLGVSSSVLMTYDYVCLYVNAFSFQAVLMRYSRNSRPVGLNNQSLKEKLFPRGTLSSPDGLYVNNAIHAATRLLKRITSSNYLREVQYLPSRFYLYAIYAAVFLYRAIEVGALKDEKQVNDTNAFISRLIARMRQASVTESHVCHIYSKMLESLQKRQNKQQEEPLYSSTHSPGASNAFINRISPPMMLTELIPSVDGDANKTVDQSGQQGFYQDNYSLYSFDEFTFSSFWPGIGDFAQPMSAATGAGI